MFDTCTAHAGTNFLMRAKAFMEAGGSPTYTLTEDFALGMEMKKYGWQCRYVQEYLAVGEAPDEIRNCFQQRSRWTKVVPIHGKLGFWWLAEEALLFRRSCCQKDLLDERGVALERSVQPD